MAPKYCRFRSVGAAVPEHSKARDRADKRNLALGKVMSRMLEMLVYGVIASLQIVVALFVLAHYTHSAALRPQARTQARTPTTHATPDFSAEKLGSDLFYFYAAPTHDTSMGRSTPGSVTPAQVPVSQSATAS